MIANNENDLISLIENCTEENDINELIKTYSLTSTLTSKISHIISTNNNQIKNILLNNTDNIIKLFSNIKAINEEFQKSKRGFDIISSQMLMYE